MTGENKIFEFVKNGVRVKMPIFDEGHVIVEVFAFRCVYHIDQKEWNDWVTSLLADEHGQDWLEYIDTYEEVPKLVTKSASRIMCKFDKNLQNGEKD